jgi:predicted nucleic acid-binding Zn finger protein
MSKDLLLEIFEKVREKQLIDEEFLTFLEAHFPDKSALVIEVLKRGITKYLLHPSNRIVWTARGVNQEHMIYPNLYCSCQDFYKSVVIKRKKDCCKHIIAQIISEALNSYKKVKLEDTKFLELLKNFKLRI